MLSRLAAHQRHPRLWAVLSALAVAQLVAFYQLCSHQVRTADDRRAAAVVQVAAADCVRHLPQPIHADCAAGTKAQGRDGVVLTVVAR